jgi:DNA-binding transcriptional ArsR family regulator
LDEEQRGEVPGAVMDEPVQARSTPPSTMSLEDLAQHAEEAAHFLKLMANPHRLMILCQLLHHELSVTEINHSVPLSQSALSQHLAVLRHAGVVSTRRDQQTIYYSLSSEVVEKIIAELYEAFCAED